MPRRVDNIDMIVTPLSRRRSSGDGYPAFTLLRHPIHYSVAIVYGAKLMRPARREENTLCHCRLSRINMRDKTYVPYLFQDNLP